jgi:diguanylate cyclase (GGDEF)-like protein
MIPVLRTGVANKEMVESLSRAAVEHVARVAGLRDFRTPTLEAVEQRRLQLWMITILLLVAVAAGLVVFAFTPNLAAPPWLTPVAARLGLLVLVGLFCAYAVEKELQLRRLTGLLIDERVVTAALTGRVRELTTLLEAGRALNLDLDLDEVLERILRCAMDLLDGSDASIMLLHAEDELSTVHTVGASRAEGARVRLGEGIAGRVAASGEPLLIQGRLDHPRAADRPQDDWPASAISAPLVHRGNPLGVLNLNARPEKTYTEHDLRALSLFAEQAAVAVANAQLFEAQRLIARQSSYQALHDPLTHLPNRARFHGRLRHALAHSRGGRRVALLLVDLDDFKRINDSLGHVAGDEVLIGFAERLKAAVRSSDAVARFGGDELAVLVDDVRSADEAALRAEALLTVLEEPFTLAGREVRLTATIGISMEGTGGSTPEELMRSADTALHVAKERGAGSLAVFVETMHADVLRRLDLESELRQAMANGEIEVHYQPIYHLVDRRVTALEALLRWRHPQPRGDPGRLLRRLRRAGRRPARARRAGADRGLPPRPAALGGRRRGAAGHPRQPAAHPPARAAHRRAHRRGARRDRARRRPPGARDHRERRRRRGRGRRLAPHRHPRPRRPHRPRRLRHRLLVARLPAPLPGPHDQDRPRLHRGPRRGALAALPGRRGGQVRPQPGPQGDRRRRRARGPGALPPRPRLHPRPGLPPRRADGGRRGAGVAGAGEVSADEVRELLGRGRDVAR